MGAHVACSTRERQRALHNGRGRVVDEGLRGLDFRKCGAQLVSRRVHGQVFLLEHIDQIGRPPKRCAHRRERDCIFRDEHLLRGADRPVITPSKSLERAGQSPVIPTIREGNRVASSAVIRQAGRRPLFSIARCVGHSLALDWLAHVGADDRLQRGDAMDEARQCRRASFHYCRSGRRWTGRGWRGCRRRGCWMSHIAGGLVEKSRKAQIAERAEVQYAERKQRDDAEHHQEPRQLGHPLISSFAA